MQLKFESIDTKNTLSLRHLCSYHRMIHTMETMIIYFMIKYRADVCLLMDCK